MSIILLVVATQAIAIMTRRVQSLSFPVLTGPSWEESTNASSFRDVQDIPILAFDRQFACSDTKIWEVSS